MTYLYLALRLLLLKRNLVYFFYYRLMPYCRRQNINLNLNIFIIKLNRYSIKCNKIKTCIINSQYSLPEFYYVYVLFNVYSLFITSDDN